MNLWTALDRDFTEHLATLPTPQAARPDGFEDADLDVVRKARWELAKRRVRLDREDAA